MTVEIDSSRLRAALRDLAASVDDPSHALDAIGAQMADRIRENIADGREYTGQPMERLKRPDLRREGKYKNRASPMPLNDTRRHIYDRINHRVVGNDAVVIGMLDTPADEEPIGRTHQFGSKKKRIPARPFMPITPGGQGDLPPEWEDDAISILSAAFKAAIK